MYLDHFGLQEKPFSIAPDPRFLYMSQRHREALAHLLYGINEGGGFVQLTGEVGTGKTTVCRCLLEKLPENVDVALILNPKLSAVELVASICDELKISYPEATTSLKSLIDSLNEHLLKTHAQGRRTVLIIDEAQNLSAEVLEQIRLLTNLETSKDKLLQIILIGQPELGDLLGLHEMRQLAQRITARYHLNALSRQETHDYVHHRLRVCGATGQLFKPGAVNEAHRLAGGVPRLINIICDRALLGAYVGNQSSVDRRTVRKAAAEVGAEIPKHKTTGQLKNLAWVAAVLLMVGAGWLVSSEHLFDSPSLQTQVATDDVPMMDEKLSVDSAPEPEPVPVPEQSKPEQSQKAELPDAPAEPVAAVETVIEQIPLEPLTGFAALLESSPPRWQAARQALLARWNIAKDRVGSGDTCEAARQHGLNCIRGQASLTRLRHMDRPVILELVARSGKTIPVVLQTLGKTKADIALGGSMHQLAVSDLRRHWQGQYIVLWKSPVATDSLRLGDSGVDVVWLRNSLQRIFEINEVSETPDQFDGLLQEQVTRFQKLNGLKADGVAGKWTIISINNVTPDLQLPRLLTEGS